MAGTQAHVQASGFGHASSTGRLQLHRRALGVLAHLQDETDAFLRHLSANAAVLNGALGDGTSSSAGPTPTGPQDTQLAAPGYTGTVSRRVTQDLQEPSKSVSAAGASAAASAVQLVHRRKALLLKAMTSFDQLTGDLEGLLETLLDAAGGLASSTAQAGTQPVLLLAQEESSFARLSAKGDIMREAAATSAAALRLHQSATEAATAASNLQQAAWRKASEAAALVGEPEP